MKCFPTIITLIALVYPCFIASTEIDLKPTPIAFQPSSMRVNGQARDPCYVNCASLDANIKSAQLKLDEASYELVAHQSIKEKGEGFCANSEYGPAFYLNIQGVSCPPGYQSARRTIEATHTTIQQLTAAPFSSAI